MKTRTIAEARPLRTVQIQNGITNGMMVQTTPPSSEPTTPVSNEARRANAFTDSQIYLQHGHASGRRHGEITIP